MDWIASIVGSGSTQKILVMWLSLLHGYVKFYGDGVQATRGAQLLEEPSGIILIYLCQAEMLAIKGSLRIFRSTILGL